MYIIIRIQCGQPSFDLGTLCIRKAFWQLPSAGFMTSLTNERTKGILAVELKSQWNQALGAQFRSEGINGLFVEVGQRS